MPTWMLQCVEEWSKGALCHRKTAPLPGSKCFFYCGIPFYQQPNSQHDDRKSSIFAQTAPIVLSLLIFLLQYVMY